MNGLKFIRTRCNLSVAELADHIDVSRQIISAWENGTRGISSKNKQKLEAFFGIDSKYFGEISEEDHKDILTWMTSTNSLGIATKALMKELMKLTKQSENYSAK